MKCFCVVVFVFSCLYVLQVQSMNGNKSGALSKEKIYYMPSAEILSSIKFAEQKRSMLQKMLAGCMNFLGAYDLQKGDCVVIELKEGSKKGTRYSAFAEVDLVESNHCKAWNYTLLNYSTLKEVSVIGFIKNSKKVS